MAEIKIRINNGELISALDKIAKDEGFSSRNQLINEILSQYVMVKNKLFIQNLPPILKEICKDTLNQQQEINSYFLQKNTELMNKILLEISDLISIFYPEREKI